MVSKALCELRNIGKTVSTRLHGIGIANEAELKRLGAEKPNQYFQQAWRSNAKKHNKNIKIVRYRSLGRAKSTRPLCKALCFIQH